MKSLFLRYMHELLMPPTNEDSHQARGADRNALAAELVVAWQKVKNAVHQDEKIFFFGEGFSRTLIMQAILYSHLRKFFAKTVYVWDDSVFNFGKK